MALHNLTATLRRCNDDARRCTNRCCTQLAVLRGVLEARLELEEEVNLLIDPRRRGHALVYLAGAHARWVGSRNTRCRGAPPYI